MDDPTAPQAAVRKFIGSLTPLVLSMRFDTLRPVFFPKKQKPRERFYLLPGQGGKNYHRKQRVFIGWSVAVAVVFGAIMAAIMWWVSHPRL